MCTCGQCGSYRALKGYLSHQGTHPELDTRLIIVRVKYEDHGQDTRKGVLLGLGRMHKIGMLLAEHFSMSRFVLQLQQPRTARGSPCTVTRSWFSPCPRFYMLDDDIGQVNEWDHHPGRRCFGASKVTLPRALLFLRLVMDTERCARPANPIKRLLNTSGMNRC